MSSSENVGIAHVAISSSQSFGSGTEAKKVRQLLSLFPCSFSTRFIMSRSSIRSQRPPKYSDDDMSDSDLMSEGASDDDMMMDNDHNDNAYSFDKKGGNKSSGSNIAFQTRWHRKLLVVLAVIAILAVWAFRNGKLQPYASKVTDNVNGWTAWARSSAGEHFIGILVALIVLDVAVDWGYGVWSRRHNM
jgi:hypothetical protein